MKLFQATASYTFVVAARDENHAQIVADRSARDAARDGEHDVDVNYEIKSVMSLPWGVDAEDYPYCDLGADDMTIGQIFEAIAAQPTPDTKTIDMFAGVAPC